MFKTAEKNLSLLLAVLTLAIFVLTLGGIFFNNVMIPLIWNVVFLASWALMLIFSMVVLFDSKAFKVSILVAIITGIIFLILSGHSVLLLSRFVKGISNRLILPNIFMVVNSQKIFYTSLILTYFIHVFNYVRLNSKTKEVDKVVSQTKQDLDKNTTNTLSKEELEILNSHKSEDNPFILSDNSIEEGEEDE